MNQSTKKIILAGTFGHALECYDFSLYAFFSPILALVFFPHHDSFISLLLVFTVFSLSYVVRPLGGIFFGFLGDHYGRKKALILTMILMSISTLLLGLLPSYETIGVEAPILLMGLRLIQGIAAAGEMGTAMSYLVEHAPAQKRGFFGSLSMSSAVLGGAAGSAIIALITAMVSHEQLLYWGWRLPFILGGVFGIIGLFQRLNSLETVAYQSLLAEKKEPFFKHFRQINYQPLFMTIVLSAIMSIGFYLFVAYFNTFLIDTMKQPTQQIMFIMFIEQLLLTLFIPFLGLLSDKIGRKPVLMMGIGGLVFCIHPVFWLLQQPSFISIFLGESLFVVFLAPIIALIPTTLAEMFPVHTRNSGVSLGYSISQAIFGGTTPLVALTLTAHMNNLYAPAWYLLCTAVIALIVVFTLKETYQESLT